MGYFFKQDLKVKSLKFQFQRKKCVCFDHCESKIKNGKTGKRQNTSKALCKVTKTLNAIKYLFSLKSINSTKSTFENKYK